MASEKTSKSEKEIAEVEVSIFFEDTRVFFSKTRIKIAFIYKGRFIDKNFADIVFISSSIYNGNPTSVYTYIVFLFITIYDQNLCITIEFF